eukprot:UN15303
MIRTLSLSFKHFSLSINSLYDSILNTPFDSSFINWISCDSV